MLYHVTEPPSAGPTVLATDESAFQNAVTPGFYVAPDAGTGSMTEEVVATPFCGEEGELGDIQPGATLSSINPNQPGSMHIAFGTRVFDASHPANAEDEGDEEPEQAEEGELSELQQAQLRGYLELRRLYRPRKCKFTGTVYAEAWNTPGVRKRHDQYSHRGDDLSFEEDEAEAAQNEEDEKAAALHLLLEQPEDFESEGKRLHQRQHDDLHCTRRCVRTGLLYTEACNHMRAARYCPGKIHPQGRFWTCCGQKEAEALPCRIGRHEDRPEFAVFYAEYQMRHSDLIGRAEAWSNVQEQSDETQ